MVRQRQAQTGPKTAFDLKEAVLQGVTDAVTSTQKFIAEADPGSVDATSAAARNVCRAVVFLKSLQRVADLARVDCALLLRQQVCNLWGSVFVLRRALVLPFLGFHRTPFVVGRWVGPCATTVMLNLGADLLSSLWLMAMGLELPPPLGTSRRARQRDLMIDCMPEMSLTDCLTLFEGLREQESARIVSSAVQAIPAIDFGAVHAVLVNEHAFAARHPETSSAKLGESLTGRAVLTPTPSGMGTRAPRNARERFIVVVFEAWIAGRPLTRHEDILKATEDRFGVPYAPKRPSKDARQDIIEDAELGGYRLAHLGDAGITTRTRHLRGLGYAVRQRLVVTTQVPKEVPQ